MAIEETTQRLISNDSLTPAQVSLNDKVLLPRTTSDPLTTVGTIKSDLVVECTGAPDSEGRYNATVLNNGSDFAVYNGLEVTCKFTNACSVTNPKFMINNLGAAGMRLANQASTVDIGVNCWSAGAILCLKYVSFSDGTAYWLLKDISTASISNGVITRADGTTEYNKQSVDTRLSSKWVFSQTIYDSGNTTPKTYTSEAIGSASSLLVGVKWGNYKLSQILLKKGTYHFIFDRNGTFHTTVVNWSGNVIGLSNTTDVYIDSISAIVQL